MEHVRAMRNSLSRYCDAASAPGLTSAAASPYKPGGRGLEPVAPFRARIRSFLRETDLPTIAARPQTAPRLSRAYGDEGRTEGACAAPSQGAQAPVGLTTPSL